MSNQCDCPPVKPCPDGIPAWVLTFADLMSLLLAFFVLLFSFSELDVLKYKQVAGSMNDAFGVQREVHVKDPPKGINIIAQEFSAGTPEPTTINRMRQHTTDDWRQYLKVPKALDEELSKMEQEGQRLRMIFAEEIAEGSVELEIDDPRIVIRILEKSSFSSGSTELIEPFRTILDKMAKAISLSDGIVVIAGHTDNQPIFTTHFRSNWELSSSRAVTVVHELLKKSNINSHRFRIEGYSDTRPVDTNDTKEGRSRNRRVEVTLLYEDSDASPEAGGLSNNGGPNQVPEPENADSFFP